MEEVDAALRDILRAVPGWSGDPDGVVPIETGITNRNFRVDAGGSSFVVRLPGARTELLGIDRRAEHEAALAAARAGVGPEVVAFVSEAGALVTRFVAGEHISQADLRREDVLGRVVASVRTLHACPPISASFPVFRIVDRYLEVATEHGVDVPAEFGDALAVAGRIEAAFLQVPAREQTCHNDLLNANLLLDGDHVWIVDYEYAGVGDPYFDLGNLSINNELDDDACELLLRLYLGSVTDVHRARLSLMRIVSDLREATWALVQQGISVLDVDFVEYADRHVARCLANAADDRLNDWIDAVEAA